MSKEILEHNHLIHMENYGSVSTTTKGIEVEINEDKNCVEFKEHYHTLNIDGKELDTEPSEVMTTYYTDDEYIIIPSHYHIVNINEKECYRTNEGGQAVIKLEDLK